MAKTNNATKSSLKPKGKKAKLALVVDNSLTESALKKIQVRKMNRKARQKVFRELVASTLENPNHPYYSLINPQTRQAMVDAITDHLISSHYFPSS